MEEKKTETSWVGIILFISMILLTILNLFIFFNDEKEKENICLNFGFEYTDYREEYEYVKCCNVTKIILENNLSRRGEICQPYFFQGD